VLGYRNSRSERGPIVDVAIGVVESFGPGHVTHSSWRVSAFLGVITTLLGCWDIGVCSTVCRSRIIACLGCSDLARYSSNGGGRGDGSAEIVSRNLWRSIDVVLSCH